jgi:hypothetical protein
VIPAPILGAIGAVVMLTVVIGIPSVAFLALVGWL